MLGSKFYWIQFGGARTSVNSFLYMNKNDLFNIMCWLPQIRNDQIRCMRQSLTIAQFHVILILYSISFNSGYYMCTASNGIGVLKKILYINVNGKLFAYCITNHFLSKLITVFIWTFSFPLRYYPFSWILCTNFNEYNLNFHIVCINQNRPGLKAPQETYRHAETIQFH